MFRVTTHGYRRGCHQATVKKALGPTAGHTSTKNMLGVTRGSKASAISLPTPIARRVPAITV